MIPDPSHAAFKYRPEVDGLRALAVLPVILFHAGFEAFRGGFVGVDVFFVISGYLITSIVLNDCRAGKFSIATFYERRARRILPALFLVMAVCIPFAAAWMLPAELQSFARSMLATVAFVPNLYFWSSTQYFGNAAEEMPLLHTWSLGVEEQFYLLFPLLIWGLWRFGLRAVVAVTVALALVSFGLSEWAWRSGKMSANFFLPFTRAWELMIGAMLAQSWHVRPVYDRLSAAWCNALSLFGLGLLAYAVFAFDANTPMPGVYALVPTLGAALLIATARADTWAHRLLAHRAMVGVGLVSYSAYLWHQPLFAFARIRLTDGPPWTVYAALSVLTLVLAYLTWRFVEAPFRSSRLIARGSLVRWSLAGGACLAVAGLVAETTDGFVARLPAADVGLAAMIDTSAQGQYVTKRFLALNSDFTATAQRKVLVVGDSYAQDFVNALFESGKIAGNEVRTFYVSPRCQIYFGNDDVSEHVKALDRPTCSRVRDASSLKRRIAQADIVILSSSWAKWAAERLPATIAALGTSPRQQLYVVGPKRVGRVNVRELLQQPAERRLLVGQATSPETLEIEGILARGVPAGTYVSMQSAVCGNGPECRLFTPEGDLLSFDGTHLTAAGARHAGRALLSTPPLTALSARAP